MVKIAGLGGSANNMERNEKVTIGKAGLADTGIRLSCQLLINECLDGTVVEIAGDGY
jgi:hypothetical protein